MNNPYVTSAEAFAETVLCRWKALPQLPSLYPQYGRYLEALVAGDRKEANNTHARAFTEKLLEKNHQTKLEIVYAILEILEWRESPRMVGSPYEFLKRVIKPTLRNELTQNPKDFRPHLWLALLLHVHGEAYDLDSFTLLEQAYSLAPNDVFVIERIVNMLVHGIWFACHHLPDGLLASEESVVEDNKRVRSLLEHLPQSVRLSYEYRLNESLDRFKKWQLVAMRQSSA